MIVTVETWHEAIVNPRVAGAILDRLVNKAYRISLSSDSTRRRLSGLAQAGPDQV